MVWREVCISTGFSLIQATGSSKWLRGSAVQGKAGWCARSSPPCSIAEWWNRHKYCISTKNSIATVLSRPLTTWWTCMRLTVTRSILTGSHTSFLTRCTTFMDWRVEGRALLHGNWLQQSSWEIKRESDVKSLRYWCLLREMAWMPSSEPCKMGWGIDWKKIKLYFLRIASPQRLKRTSNEIHWF